MLLARFVVSSKLGRILVAIRDKEDASGSPVTMSPASRSSCSALPRPLRHRRRDVHAAGRFHVAVLRRHRAVIEMVIFAAVGGRHSIVGAVTGTLLVNWGKTVFSESFRNSGCSASAGCSSPWCCCSRADLPAS